MPPKAAPKPAPKTEGSEKKSTHTYEVNHEKLEKLKKAAEMVRTGGKGTPRRKFKAIRKTSTADDVKVQQALRKFNLNKIPDVSEVNFILENGNAMSFDRPAVQAGGGTFVIAGKYTEKSAAELANPIENVDLQKLKEMYEQLQKQGALPTDSNIPDVDTFETVN
ncbi:nascent polypeptide-associated complex subunit beta [Acrasis kona]|uniref:Nascent polypeptide-associated complex subunit beta n=1 Tax=Acrasis kona TaxID=1008807 RepID=A0AAW2YQD9_9EUKA